MPEKLINHIKNEYIKRGKSPDEAERIAYATLNKQGKLENEDTDKDNDKKDE